MVRSDSKEKAKAALLVAVGVLLIVPIYMLFVGSLKDDMYEIIKDMGTAKSFIALHPTLHNYYEILFESVQNFSRAFLNSMVVLITTVILTFLVSSMAGYSLQQGQLRWRKILLVVVISLYIIPMEAIMMPLMYQVTAWHITDTYIVQILPFVASPIYIFLFYQFFKQVPVSLAEAAQLEGATFFQIYRSVYLPMSTSPIITVCILQGMDMWNQYLWPLLVTTKETVRPMSVSIASFTGTGGIIYWDQLMAASVVMFLPMLLLFLFFQRYFIESVASSAVKE